ncbi:metallophosphoesterase [Sphingobacterium spiritivorum]|nr:metallophosphoesterase [Sphingobacterium spiritivorum]
MNTRRYFLKSMGVASATFALSAHQQAFAQTIQQQDFDFRVRPYLQDLQGDRVTVMTHINRKGFTWLEVRAQGEQQFRKVVQSEDGLINANTLSTVLTIHGLQPGKTYEYRVYSKEILTFEAYKVVYGKEISSPLYAFKTPDENSQATSCVIYNDVHGRAHSYGQLLDSAGKPEFDFAILNGDMFDYVTNEEDLYDKLLTPLGERFASEKPFFMLRGNHETRGAYSRDFKTFFRYEDNTYYGTFRRGPVSWLMLDTGEDKPDTAEVYAGVVDFDQYRIDQAKWAEKIMASDAFRKSTFRVVVMHIPPFYSGEWHGPMEVQRLFAPLFDKYKVDVVISGHTHTYGFHEATAKHSYPVFIGGGPKEGNRTLIHVKADNRKLEVNMILDNGTNVGTYSKTR